MAAAAVFAVETAIPEELVRKTHPDNRQDIVQTNISCKAISNDTVNTQQN